jgi:NADH-quinone oxidoreductase subunit M
VFWGELLAIAGAWQAAGDGALGWTGRPLAVFGALGTLIAAAYWLRVLREFWQGEPSPRWEGAVMGDATTHETSTVAPLVIATFALGLVPGPLLGMTEPVVTSILRAGGSS